MLATGLGQGVNAVRSVTVGAMLTDGGTRVEGGIGSSHSKTLECGQERGSHMVRYPTDTIPHDVMEEDAWVDL